jgi:hypothetical protein
MATVLEEYATEEKCSAVCYFCGQKDSMQRIFIKKCFLFTVGSVCHVKRFHFRGKRSTDDEEVETEVRKWLRQQSKDFCASGFDAPVKPRDKCINVSGGYVEKLMFIMFYIHL